MYPQLAGINVSIGFNPHIGRIIFIERFCDNFLQLRFWYLSHKRSAKAQASLRIRAVSPEPSLFVHMNYGSRRRVRPKIRHLASLDGCACAFEDSVYGGR